MLERLNKIWRMQEAYTDYPKAASDNAKAAIRWADKNGWGSCGTAVGKARANQLANREPISLETIERMAAFIRHKRNSNAGVNWAIKMKIELPNSWEGVTIEQFQALQKILAEKGDEYATNVAIISIMSGVPDRRDRNILSKDLR
jgi:hypothetical protein